MSLRIVGAGVGRTGTHSLKAVLEQLVGGTCHHMEEVFLHPDEIEVWAAAVEGEHPDWKAFLGGYTASIDWPSAAFWAEISEAFPDAGVLLSTRPSGEEWWRSANATIVEMARTGFPDAPVDSVEGRQIRMWRALLTGTFCADWDDADAMIAAYERHNAEVRASVPADRLIEYRTGDGWGPICEWLGVAVPDEAFPHHNTLEEFQAEWME